MDHHLCLLHMRFFSFILHMINFDKLEIFRIEKLQNLKLEKAQREEWGGELTFLNSSGELSESGASAALETVSPDKKN